MILELKGIYKDYQQGKMSVPVLIVLTLSRTSFPEDRCREWRSLGQS